ncbi:hypothetical protein C3S39_10260 [Salmonella enterica]|nr:hypothetical protein [Salmonella enterica]
MESYCSFYSRMSKYDVRWFLRREEKFRIHKYKIFIIYILLIVSVDVYLRIAVVILSMGQIL